MSDEFDDEQFSRMKVGMDASEEWTKVGLRIAEALEHLAATQALQQMAMAGLEPGPVAPVRHTAGCVACSLLKSGKPMDPQKIIRAAAVSGGLGNGGGIKKP